jgi:3-hydroxybenzoate 6-monooxygenase
MDPILVAGGGVGGLGAALAVACAGFPVRFFERSAECREIGVRGGWPKSDRAISGESA